MPLPSARPLLDTRQLSGPVGTHRRDTKGLETRSSATLFPSSPYTEHPGAPRPSSGCKMQESPHDMPRPSSCSCNSVQGPSVWSPLLSNQEKALEGPSRARVPRQGQRGAGRGRGGQRPEHSVGLPSAWRGYYRFSAEPSVPPDAFLRKRGCRRHFVPCISHSVLGHRL